MSDTDKPDDTAAFYAIASDTARFHLDRSESVQQRAVGILGFAGVMLSLVPLLLQLIDDVSETVAAVAVAFLILGAISLVTAVGWAAATIMTLKVRYPTTAGIRDRFEAGESTNDDIRELWSAAMIRDSIPAFEAEATQRIRNFKASVLFTAAGVLFTGVSLLTFTIGKL